MPPTYTEHATDLRAPEDELVVPLALYADAVPYSHTDSVLGFWVVNLVTDNRYFLRRPTKEAVLQVRLRGLVHVLGRI